MHIHSPGVNSNLILILKNSVSQKHALNSLLICKFGKLLPTRDTANIFVKCFFGSVEGCLAGSSFHLRHTDLGTHHSVCQLLTEKELVLLLPWRLKLYEISKNALLQFQRHILLALSELSAMTVEVKVDFLLAAADNIPCSSQSFQTHVHWQHRLFPPAHLSLYTSTATWSHHVLYIQSYTDEA